MVTEQTMVALRINYIRNYMSQVVKVMFDTHLKIQYKIQSDKLMHMFFIYENKIKTLKETKNSVRRPSISILKGIRKILDDTVNVIKKGDQCEKIFQQIVIIQARKYSPNG